MTLTLGAMLHVQYLAVNKYNVATQHLVHKKRFSLLMARLCHIVHYTVKHGHPCHALLGNYSDAVTTTEGQLYPTRVV